MKAIKLASIFAVSAIAAAVSTTTFAADPVFSGSAGMYFTSNDAADTDDEYSSDGEVNIIGDTGVVYFDMDMSSGSFILDEAYVTQGAVQFGDFDGSLIDSAVMYGGVDEGDDYSKDGGATLGVRYAVSDDLTVAFEATDGSDNDGIGVSYSADLGVAALTISGGVQGDDGSLVAAGVEMPLGSATLAGYVQQGTDEDNTDVASMGVGVDFAVSDALSISAAYLADTESDGDINNMEITAYYTAGDITYMVDYLDYSEDAGSSDWIKVGATASF